MARLTISLLGKFQALLDDEPLASFRTNKVQALLIYLAVEQRPQRREWLIELLWPGMPERSARHNLRQVLYNLRQVLPELSAAEGTEGETAVSTLLTNRQTIQLNPQAALTVDVHEFETQLHSVQDHAHVDLLVCQRCRQTLAAAVSLYQSDFLADFYLSDSNEFEEWAEVTRQAYRRKALDALEALTAIHIRQSDYREAQEFAQRQLEVDNLRESAYRQLMEIYALSGRREEALALYESCRRLLGEELGMAPTTRTSEMYRQIVAGDLRFDAPANRGVRGLELKEEIGSGAYGVIYRAVQPTIGREVAVKVIRPRYANDPEFIRRFESEAQTVARLEHPYIVPLYDYWRDPEGAYLVMRLLRGGSLLSSLENGPLQPDTAVTLLNQLASALTSAHQLGIVHRDIKPANILFDEANNAYLTDFGIAKDLASDLQLTGAGEIAGTPDYVSPEQLTGQQVTPQADQYSLGAVLYETLTGEKPFSDAPLAIRIQKHLAEPLPLVCDSRPDLPGQVDAVIQRATAKEPTARFTDMLAMAEAFRQAVHGLAPTTVVDTAVPSTRELTNPYKGLRAFQESDASDFFGREVLIEQMVAGLADSNFLAVVGPSGAGKSSVVKAGLVPALRQGALPGSENWFVAEMVPGSHPLEELALRLLPVAVDPPPSLLDPMQKDERGLLRTLRRILPGDDAHLLLVIDQFEELFTLTDSEARRHRFLNSLLAVLSAPRSPLHVVVTLRADFYDRPLQIKPIADLFKENSTLVLPMSNEEIAWAVQEPARRQGVTLEEGVMTAMVHDVADQPGALPLLQYALTELFEERQGLTMTLSSYRALGGVTGALAQRAEELFNGLSAAEQAVTRQLFLRLVTLEDGREHTRRRVLRSELEAVGESVGEGNTAVPHILDTFGRHRLLTFDRDPLTREATVEVAHEALLGNWQRLRAWLGIHREDIRQQRLLAAAAQEWTEAGQDESFLLRGARLEQFERWAAATAVALTQGEQTFLSASSAARQQWQEEEETRQQRELETLQQLAQTEKKRAQEQTRAAQRLRQRAYFLVGALAVALVLAVFAFVNSNRATQNAALAATAEAEAIAQRNAAQTQTNLATSRELSLAALNNLEADPQLSILLALQALETSHTKEAEEALHWAVQATRVMRILADHTDLVEGVAYSADGTKLATVSLDGTVKVWEAATGELRRTLPYDGVEYVGNTLRFDEAGERLSLLVIGDNLATSNLHIWDVASGTLLSQTELPVPAEFFRFDLSPDWQLLAVGRENGIPELWDMATGEQLLTLSGHDGAISSAVFSADGSRLVTTSFDGQAQVWNMATVLESEEPQPELALSIANDEGLTRAFFSNDGTRLALVFFATVEIWDLVDTNQPQLPLTGHNNAVHYAAFAPDDARLATASADSTVKVWDLASGEELFALSGHEATVFRLAFSPDGRFLTTASHDGTARIWNVARDAGGEAQTFFHAGDIPMVSLELSPDDQKYAFGTINGTTVVGNAATGEQLLTLQNEFDGPVHGVSFHPNGSRLATASQDGRARIWDTATGELRLQFTAHVGGNSGGNEGVLDVAYSPDGARLATAGADGLAKVWDAESGEDLLVLEGHTTGLFRVVYSGDGRYLATTSDANNATTNIWDANSGQLLHSLGPNPGRAWGLAFSPDSQLVATGGAGGFLQVWNVATGKEASSLTGQSSEFGSVLFTPDGQQLITSGVNGVTLWDLASGTEILNLAPINSKGAALTQDGRQLYVVAAQSPVVRVYAIELIDAMAVAESLLTRWWTVEECRQYLHADICPVRE
ncbi:MAG: hypothetical protein CL608_23765 [Anaerolineaceae bacterium]|nr:hypothetical protein [Anaerolineaceae bacterium]